MAGIEIIGLNKSFSTREGAVHVLRGLDLSVETNEITVVLGKSGCGKTTLLRVVAGLETPDKGSVLFEDRNKTGFIFQEPRLMPWLNVRDNILFGLKRAERSDREAQTLIHTVGLDGFAKAYPHQLSGGMQQRVAIGRALACHPAFLMMDEPFAALDHFTREDMQRELLRVRRETGVSILFVTHSIDEALVLADRIVILAQGRIDADFRMTAGRARDPQSRESLTVRSDILEALARNKRDSDHPNVV